MTDSEWLWPQIEAEARLCRCDGAIASDAMQECAARYLAAKRRRTIENPAAYVSTILRSCIADQHRQRRRAVECVVIRETDRPAVGQLPRESRDPADIVRTRMDIPQAIDSLPCRERMVMRMHYIDGLSPGDIAEALCMREATVCRTLSRGRARLREMHLIAPD